MSYFFFLSLLLSIVFIYMICRRHELPAVGPVISDALGFVVFALISNILFSLVVDVPGLNLSNTPALLSGGLSWTAVVFAAIIFQQTPIKEIEGELSVPAPWIKPLAGYGILSTIIGIFAGTIVDLFVFFGYGLLLPISAAIPPPLIWAARIIYVLACVLISYFTFQFLYRKMRRRDHLEERSEIAIPSPVKLWSPRMISLSTLFFGFPSGFVLSSINWVRMGLAKKAVVHLAVGAVGTFTLILLLLLLPRGYGRGLALLVNFGLIFYLGNQIRNDTEDFKRAHHEVKTANWFGGCLIDILMLGVYLFAVTLVVMVLNIFGFPIAD